MNDSIEDHKRYDARLMGAVEKAAADTKKMKVLEFKHHAPFDGCWWQYEYVPFEEVDGKPVGYNITDRKWPYKETPQEILEHGLQELDLENRRYEWNRQYDTFQVYEWNKQLHKALPDNWLPIFWAFAQEHDLQFWWVCAECGNEVAEMPAEMAGYHGNGGVGIEVDGWLCDECACEQVDREEAERDAERKAEAEQLAAAMLEDDYDFRTWPEPRLEIYVPPANQQKLAL